MATGITSLTTRRLPRVAVAALSLAMVGSLSLTACTGTGTGGSSSTPGAPAGNKKNAVFTTIDGNKAITPGGVMNPFNAKNNMFSGYNTQQLAYTRLNPTNINDFFPALAEKWDWSSDLKTLTVTLNPKAGWSDGTPVTSKDVVTSFAAGIVAGTASGLNIGKVEAVGDKQIKFTQLETGKPSRTFMMNILSTNIVRDAEYGSLLPADIWDTILASQGTGDAAKAAKDKITALTPKITSHAPAKDISNGPFSITAVNPGEAVLEKNPNFWAADKIGPSKLVIRNYAGNQEIWNYLQSGALDFGPFTAMPENTKDAIIKAGNKMVQSPSPVQASLAFNQSIAPYGKVEVRQAFAYLLDREAITKVGQPVGGSPVQVQSGFTKNSFDAWATDATKSKMEAYKNDKAKAEELLKKAGMTKGGDGKWLKDDGTPFKVTMQTVTGFSDWIAGSNVVCSELNDFGIPCEVQVSADFATYQNDMKAQKFGFGWWLVSVGTNPPAAMGRIFGDTYGYKVVGGNVTYTPPTQKDGGNWMGGPQEIKIATGETVKPGELNANMNYQSPEEQKPVLQQLFLAENASLPVIGVWDYTNTVFVNESRFTNFPDGSDAGLMRLSPGVWMSHGFIQPK